MGKPFDAVGVRLSSQRSSAHSSCVSLSCALPPLTHLCNNSMDIRGSWPLLRSHPRWSPQPSSHSRSCSWERTEHHHRSFSFNVHGSTDDWRSDCCCHLQKGGSWPHRVGRAAGGLIFIYVFVIWVSFFSLLFGKLKIRDQVDGGPSIEQSLMDNKTTKPFELVGSIVMKTPFSR